ncbi:hypothetical protein CVD28_01310 [Bacillus sp. M6-12]|uniref:hypothetical protein n=1 Tax=Bacillus sp. M6-12 TaxID=2054166 RepID=UPI000C776E9C|nr:hypothetical protein [Bacillus sp. M6-12]PLS19072.1 hypothetical protein CVD28_01310 [Bacillus sp. M6-12]
MELNIITIVTILADLIFLFGIMKIDTVLKKADVEEKIRLQVNYMLVLFGLIVGSLSGYIIFFTN